MGRENADEDIRAFDQVCAPRSRGWLHSDLGQKPEMAGVSHGMDASDAKYGIVGKVAVKNAERSLSPEAWRVDPVKQLNTGQSWLSA